MRNVAVAIQRGNAMTVLSNYAASIIQTDGRDQDRLVTEYKWKYVKYLNANCAAELCNVNNLVIEKGNALIMIEAGSKQQP